MIDWDKDALAEIFATLNIYVFGFTLGTLALGTYMFRGWQLIGAWFLHMLCWYTIIKVVDLYGFYFGIDRDPLFFHARQLFARCIILWGAAYCFLYGALKLRQPPRKSPPPVPP